ncbi:MAG: hypothetical protein E2O93_04070 [Alphaproteobacteria bacterium]|nr:MAG: hypothetical protein E2O93_04070 [Alphaproteobacteria bacterium]
MCGDIDDDTSLDDELLARLTANAKKYDAVAGGGDASGATDFSGGADRSRYMSKLFRDGLSRALADANAAPDGARTDAIACQAIVLARLAGFLAGHIPPGADMFRTLVDAVMDGYKEPSENIERHSHDHHAHDH